jgi:LAO/AO transport system kinase
VQASALKRQGLEQMWQAIGEFRRLQMANGRWAQRRQEQSLAWMWDQIEQTLKERFIAHPAVRDALPAISQAVRDQTLAPSTAARQLLSYSLNGVD